MAKVQTGEFSSYSNNLIDELGKTKKFVWDLGPEEPMPPEEPTIEVVPGDLAQPNTPTEIFAFTQERGITIGLLVNNAGVGSYGAFRASDRERELEIIQLNCSALVHLTHLYLLDMVERRSGAILTVSSLRHTRVCPTWPPTPQAKGSAYSSPRR